VTLSDITNRNLWSHGQFTSHTIAERTMSDERMDQIIDTLAERCQRATYGALAATVGRAPRTLMKGRERDQRHSWIVNRKNGEPTGYGAEQMHPDLKRREHVIETRAELEQWLETNALEVAH
jgi:type II secretory pathway component PulJ